MAYEGMLAEPVTITGHGGDAISAYVARPLGAGPFPGVVLIHHLPGWDEWYREATRRFAHHGDAAISHYLYQRAGEGRADDVAAKVRAEGGVPDAQEIGDTLESAKALQAALSRAIAAAEQMERGWGRR
jgi:carboxymethylenebutenolidase